MPHVAVVLELPMFAEGSGAVGALVWGGVEGVDVNAWREFGSKVLEF